MRATPGLFALGLGLTAALGLLWFGEEREPRGLVPGVRAADHERRPDEPLAPAAAPAASAAVPAPRGARGGGGALLALDDLAERVRWRPLSMPDWQATVRAQARELGDAEVERLETLVDDPALPDEALLAASELLRECQALRGSALAALAPGTAARLRATLERAGDDLDLARLAANSLAALGGAAEARALLELALDGAPSAQRGAARDALAFAPHAFVAEALADRGADEDVATLERLGASSAWAFDGVTRLLVAERLALACQDPARELAARRRALATVAAWDEREGMEIALELLADESQPDELTRAAAETLVRAADGGLSPVETLLLEAEDLERATTLAAALAARARDASGWSRSVASRALCRAAESATSANARRSALLALGSLGDLSTLPSLASVLRSEEDATVRGACVVALSKWTESDAAARLLAETAERDPSPSVRILAENACRSAADGTPR